MAKKKRKPSTKSHGKTCAIRQDRHVRPTPERMDKGDVIQYGNRYLSETSSLQLMLRRDTITEEQHDKCCLFFEWKAQFDMPLTIKTSRYEKEVYDRNDIENMVLDWKDAANRYYYVSSRMDKDNEVYGQILMQIMECGFTVDNIRSFYKVRRTTAVAMIRQALNSMLFYMDEIINIARDAKEQYSHYNSYSCVKNTQVMQECYA